jgi:hypothetical protein
VYPARCKVLLEFCDRSPLVMQQSGHEHRISSTNNDRVDEVLRCPRAS